MVELRSYLVASVVEDPSKSIILDPESEWDKDRVTIGQSLYALSTTGSVLLEWHSIQAQGSSKESSEAKKTY